MFQAGDIVLFRGKSWLSRTIRFHTREKGERISIFNHVGIMIDDHYLVEALRKVERTSINDAINDNTQLIAVFRNNHLDYSDKHQLSLYAQRQVGKKYGYLKILGHAGDYWLSRILRTEVTWMRKLFRNGRYPICSWLVAYAYARVCGKEFNETHPSYCQPDDIADEVMDYNRDEWELVFAEKELSWINYESGYFNDNRQRHQETE